MNVDDKVHGMSDEPRIDLTVLPGFVLRDFWLDGKITDQEYNSELGARQLAEQAKSDESTTLRIALEALLVQALQSDLNSPANQWGSEAIWRARGALGGKWSATSEGGSHA